MENLMLMYGFSIRIPADEDAQLPNIGLADLSHTPSHCSPSKDHLLALFWQEVLPLYLSIH